MAQGNQLARWAHGRIRCGAGLRRGGDCHGIAGVQLGLQCRQLSIERCQAQADKLEQQRVDIDATLNELNQFIALVKAQVEES